MDTNVGFTRRALRRGAAVLATGAALAVATAATTFGSASGASADTPTTPPPLTFLTPHGPVGNGDIFITPTGDTSTHANGPEVLSKSGRVIWFHAVPAGQGAYDFRTQRHEGQAAALRRRLRRLGQPALHLPVRPGGPRAVQRTVPDRREHLPRLPAAVEARRVQPYPRRLRHIAPQVASTAITSAPVTGQGRS
jgi:hypothetical protein